MARPQLPFRTDHPALMRRREQLADLIYPGGLDRFQVSTLGGDAVASDLDPVLARLAARTATEYPILTLDGPLARELTGRVSADLRKQVAQRLDGEQRELWDRAPEEYRAILAVTFGLYYDVPGIAEATGMRAVMPPADVHAMSHLPQATGGDIGYADAVARLAAEAGVPIGDGVRVLDFGCSSGRVIRALAAAYPGATLHGCDPNAPAIAWAAEHLPEISFTVSPQRPPLTLADDSLDVAYAISIWSHFNAEPGLQWLAEMARLIRSGGVLIFSTHGFQSIAIRAGRGEAWGGALARAANDMYTSGFSFFNPFGAEGDWGVVDADWGMGFMTPEWLLPRVLGDWTLEQFHAAALEGDQDVYVLRRR